MPVLPGRSECRFSAGLPNLPNLSYTPSEYVFKDHLGDARLTFADLNGNGVVVL